MFKKKSTRTIARAVSTGLILTGIYQLTQLALDGAADRILDNNETN